MAVELEIKCSVVLSVEEIIQGCKKVLGTYFRLENIPSILPRISCLENFDLEVLPHAKVNVLFYSSPVFNSLEDQELWSCISMNPSRTPQSFLLGISVAIALAHENNNPIMDEAKLLGQGSIIALNELKIPSYIGTFDEVAIAFARDYDIFQ